MSVEACRWAWLVTGVGPSAKAVLIALADHADERGHCWPSIDLLARKTELNRTTVIRSLQRLEEREVIRRRRSKGGTSTRYDLMIGAANSGTTPLSDSRTTPLSEQANSGTTPLQQSHHATQTVAPRHPNHQEPSENHHSLSRREQILKVAGETHERREGGKVRGAYAKRFRTDVLADAEWTALLERLTGREHITVEDAATALVERSDAGRQAPVFEEVPPPEPTPEPAPTRPTEPADHEPQLGPAAILANVGGRAAMLAREMPS
jgi:hypothetical protein